ETARRSRTGCYQPPWSACGGKNGWRVLKEVAPGVRRVAVVHVPEITANVAFVRVIEAASTAFGVTVTAAGVRNDADVERVLTAFAQEPNGGLIVTPSPLTATMRWVVGGKAAQRSPASPSQMGRFETQWLAVPKNFAALAHLSGQWIDLVHGRRPPRGIVLDIDSSVSPTHGEQEMSVWNGHY